MIDVDAYMNWLTRPESGKENVMSWSASGKILTQPGRAPVIELSAQQTQTGNGAQESKDALEMAKTVARDIVDTGRLGTGEFTVNLSGHANDGNKPVPGWSNDYLTITINQQSPPK
jgi:hypothetical protein